jgi:hypothetical protein
MIEGECKTTYETLILQDKKTYETQQPRRGSFKHKIEKPLQSKRFDTAIVNYNEKKLKQLNKG